MKQYPRTLAELAPKYTPSVPIDPYTGQPFVYRLKGDTAILYALGGDRDDDGGKHVPNDDVKADGDVVWTSRRRDP